MLFRSALRKSKDAKDAEDASANEEEEEEGEEEAEEEAEEEDEEVEEKEKEEEVKSEASIGFVFEDEKWVTQKQFKALGSVSLRKTKKSCSGHLKTWHLNTLRLT